MLSNGPARDRTAQGRFPSRTGIEDRVWLATGPRDCELWRLRNDVRIQLKRDSWVAVSHLCAEGGDARALVNQRRSDTMPKRMEARERIFDCLCRSLSRCECGNESLHLLDRQIRQRTLA
jgi:hypothetical protein